MTRTLKEKQISNEKEEALGPLDVVSLFLVGGLIYYPLQIILNFLSGKIKNKKQLEVLLKKEAFKLGLGDSKIVAKFGKTPYGAHCERLTDGSYEIVMDNPCKSRSALRHELYHIYKKDPDTPEASLLRRIWIREPRATLYQALGIRL